MDEKKRPQSVDEWSARLLGQPAAAAPGDSTLATAPPAPGAKRWRWAAAAAAVLIIVIAALGAWNKRRPDALSDQSLQPLRRDLEGQFRGADANGDGYLQPPEVRGRFPAIARDFERVDHDKDGRISMREFLEFRRTQLERKAAK